MIPSTVRLRVESPFTSRRRRARAMRRSRPRRWSAVLFALRRRRARLLDRYERVLECSDRAAARLRFVAARLAAADRAITALEETLYGTH